MKKLFKLKTRILQLFIHALFWIAVIAILNSSIFDLEWGPFSKEEGTLLIALIYGMLINIFLMYWNAYRMIPVFLHRKKLQAFWAYSALMLFGLSFVEFFADVIYYLSFIEVPGQTSVVSENSGNEVLEIIIWFGLVFLFNAMFWAMAFLYRFPKDWKRNELAQKQLIQDKLTAELDFLKAQINPHFLFNGINSIYHLIGSDHEKAQSVLLQFSELLRYQLYECNDEMISLKKEMNYLKNYILLEEVRKGEDAIIRKQLLSEEELVNLNGLKIAPLLLSPFLENAFKYLSLYSEKENNQLSIQVSVFKNELNFFVENTFDPAITQNKKRNSSGIGLENVKRRLKLLYPQKHFLSISNNEERFNVTLKITLQ